MNVPIPARAGAPHGHSGLRWAVALLMCCTTALAAPTSPWLDEQGRPGLLALQAVELLDKAASHGLQVEDYGLAAGRLALAKAGAAGPAAADGSRLAMWLDAAMQRYLQDLRKGRVDPHSLKLSFAPTRRADFDAAAVLAQALASGRLAEAVAHAAPALGQYQQLRDKLAAYRHLINAPAWQQPLPALPSTGPGRPVLSPGQDYAGLAPLAQRLTLLGDLDPLLQLLLPQPPLRYDTSLVDAVRAFQRRHGLVVDGVVGPATLAALEVRPAARVRQIELALERLRWTPLLQGRRMVVINIPEFVLRAYEVVDGQIEVRQEMRVVVGKALDTRTPLFDEDMRFIEFSPYWNVPRSIALSETLPRLQRDPSHFEREGFEFVARDGRVLRSLTPDNLDALRAGSLRIRQRPGPKNALGDIKFVFPNRQNIFLHHTPAVALFEHERRDFSHGCIRVEQPVALARFVLQGQADAAAWTDARIRQAMARGQSNWLRLDASLPVLIAYGTSLVKGGRIHFFDDLYGQDRLLDAALRRPRPVLPAPD